jgi:hypothetical protein
MYPDRSEKIRQHASILKLRSTGNYYGSGDKGSGGMKKMDKWLLPVLIIVAYFVLMRWVLPRLGVQT